MKYAGTRRAWWNVARRRGAMVVPRQGRRERPGFPAWARLRTRPRGEQRGPTAQPSFRQALLLQIAQEPGRLQLALAAGVVDRPPPHRTGVETGGDNYHPQLACKLLIDAEAEDDVHLLDCSLANGLRGIVHIEEGQVVAARDREQDPLHAENLRVDQRR